MKLLKEFVKNKFAQTVSIWWIDDSILGSESAPVPPSAIRVTRIGIPPGYTSNQMGKHFTKVSSGFEIICWHIIFDFFLVISRGL
jgi:hypothetical protein